MLYRTGTIAHNDTWYSSGFKFLDLLWLVSSLSDIATDAKRHKLTIESSHALITILYIELVGYINPAPPQGHVI
jgi:hypothetical protein